MPSIIAASHASTSSVWPSVHELITDGLIAPVVFAAITLIVFKVIVAASWRANFTRRLLPLRRWRVQTLPPRLTSLNLTVAYALIPPESVALPYYMVEEGDVRCLYLVYSLLGALYGREVVEAISEDNLRHDVHTRSNLVVLSGPVWNKTMELYLGLLGSPVRFAWDGEDLQLVGLREHYKTVYVGDHRVKECHGILLAGTIEVAGRTQHVIVIAGCSNLSTYAGASLLDRLNRDRAMRHAIKQSKIRKGRRWGVVYRVENWAEEPGGSLSSIPTMQSGPLQLAIVQTIPEEEFDDAYEFHLGVRVA